MQVRSITNVKSQGQRRSLRSFEKMGHISRNYGYSVTVRWLVRCQRLRSSARQPNSRCRISWRHSPPTSWVTLFLRYCYFSSSQLIFKS